MPIRRRPSATAFKLQAYEAALIVVLLKQSVNRYVRMEPKVVNLCDRQ